MGKVTQRDRVLQYIKDFGSITSWQAYKDLGVTQLATRISELKNLGYSFKTNTIVSTNRYGDTTHFKEYRLEEK